MSLALPNYVGLEKDVMEARTNAGSGSTRGLQRLQAAFQIGEALPTEEGGFQQVLHSKHGAPKILGGMFKSGLFVGHSSLHSRAPRVSMKMNRRS